MPTIEHSRTTDRSQDGRGLRRLPEFCFRMKGRPYSTERDGTRQRFELLALQRSLSRPAGGPIPVRLCLYVDQLILAQRKSQFLAVDATIKEQGRAASLLEDNQQRLIPESIVDHGLSLQLVEQSSRKRRLPTRRISENSSWKLRSVATRTVT